MKPALIVIISLLLIACNDDHRTQRLSSDGGTAESVFLTHDQNNNPVVIWTERTHERLTLYFAVSTDDGKSFGKKESIPLSPAVATHAEGMPKIAIKEF